MPDDSYSGSRPRWRRALRIVGIIFALLLVVGALAYWLVVPRVADSLVRQKLAGLEARAGLVADFDRVETSAVEGVRIVDFTLQRKGASEPLATVDEVRAQLDLYHMVFGQPVISAVEVGDVTLKVRRLADGRTNLEHILDELRGPADAESNSTPSSDDSGGPGFLRYFGGSWPDATVGKTSVTFTAAEGTTPFPVESLTVETLQMNADGEAARVEWSVGVTSSSSVDERWSIPSRLDFEGTLRRPLAESTGSLTVDRPVEVVGLGPLPFLRAGLKRIVIAEDYTVEVRGLSVGLQTTGEPKPIGTADTFRASFDHWPTGPGDVNFDSLVIDKPKLVADIDRQHGSAIHDLIHLTRAPVGREVAARARRVARDVYLDIPRWKRPKLEEESGDEVETEERTGVLDRLEGLLWDRLLADWTPESLKITGAEVHLTDRRRMGLDNPSLKLGLRNGRFVFEHSSAEGNVELRAGFDAYATESTPRGSVEMKVGGNYRDGTVEGNVAVDALDLSWVSQMLGRTVARRVKGGELAVKFESARDQKTGRHDFSGLASLSSATFHVDGIAEEPITELDTGYYFEGYYDPEAGIPEPTLIRQREYLSDETLDALEERAEKQEESGGGADAGGEPELKPGEDVPRNGAVVLSKGEAKLNGVSARFRPSLYGIDGFERMPTRLDMSVELEETTVQKLFDAVPTAIQGPTRGTKMKGTFGWNFRVEIPLYNAGEMEWRTKPALKNFELTELPSEVDVRRMKDGFEHQIVDERIKFKRTIQVPPMRPVPARWLVANSEISLKTLDERRREREWPPLPTRGELAPGVPPQTVQTPNVWTTDAVESQVAERPWQPRQPLATLDPEEAPDDVDRVEWAREMIREGRQERQAEQRAPAARPQADANSAPKVTIGGEQRGDAENGAEPVDPFGEMATPSSTTTKSVDAPRKKARAAVDERPDPPPLDSSLIVEWKKEKQKSWKRPRQYRGKHIHPYGTYIYVPLHHMSKWLPRAIMTTEDNSLFEHSGFNWFALQESVEENIASGGFARGGSTVSMQLVKNLYLSFDKVLARKIREAFLVWLMEGPVDIPKARILEVYFNIIEFGPGIFGIHDASVHYFGKRPDQLTLSEVAWLVSIVPNPKKYHQYYERGEISDGWWESMKTYIEIMHERERATKEDVERATAERPAFYKPKPGEPKLRDFKVRQEAAPEPASVDLDGEADDGPEEESASEEPTKFEPPKIEN